MPHLRIAVSTLFVLALLNLPLAAVVQAGKKMPIPSEKDQQAKRNEIVKELYKQEIARAKPEDTAANADLGRIFLDLAGSTDDDSAGRYALLDLAIDYAMLGGDSNTALQAIDEMDRYYMLPPRGALLKKIGTLLKASKSAASPEAYENMIESANQLYLEAVAEDDYPSALKLIAAAENAARLARSVSKVTAIRKEREKVLELEKRFARWKPFADELAKNPESGAANLHMGVYQALLKGNWDRGLPLLAKAGPGPLKTAAELDLADPTAAKTQIALAEKWLDLAQNNPIPKIVDDKEFGGGPRIQLLLRSYHWFQDALGYLSGPEHDALEQRLQKINALLPPEYAIGELTTEYRRWDLNDPGPRSPPPYRQTDPVYSAAFSPDSRKVIAAGADGVLRLLDVRSGKELRRMEARRMDGPTLPVWSVWFSADGRHVISGGFDGSIRLWDASSGRAVRTFSGHSHVEEKTVVADYVRSVVASRDGKLILSGGDDRMVRLWNADTGKEIRAFSGHDHYVWSVALSGNAKQALSASLDKTVRLWDVDTGKQLQVLRGHKDTVLSVVFMPDGRRALSGSTDKTLILWDLETGKHVVFPKKHTGYVNSVAVSPDGRRALSGSFDGTVRLWDVHAAKELRVLKGMSPLGRPMDTSHVDQVWHVAFSPAGRLALSCGEDGTLRIWSGSKYR